MRSRALFPKSCVLIHSAAVSLAVFIINYTTWNFIIAENTKKRKISAVNEGYPTTDLAEISPFRMSRPHSPHYSLTYNGGDRVIACGQCRCYLTNTTEMMSPRFQGSTGKASLYFRVWNIRCSEKQTRDMMTGKHIVRDVECIQCGFKLGWMYEYAMNDDQKYKEQRVILENKLVQEVAGLIDPEYGSNGPYPLVSYEHDGSPVAVIPEEPIATHKRITFKQSKKR